MDDYGIVAAVKVALQTYEHTCRQTGRTARMIERVTRGDQIICLTDRDVEILQARLLKAGKPGVCVMACDPVKSPMRHINAAPPGRRTFFDHPWITRYLTLHLEDTLGDLGDYIGAASTPQPTPQYFAQSQHPVSYG